MIYEVKYTQWDEKNDIMIGDENIFTIDDLVLFNHQPEAFRKIFRELQQGNIAEFDNATAILLETNRILITSKD